MGTLVDGFGRIAADLRVSLTDRCNLRCSYCMPAEGLHWLPTPDVLTDDEVVRLIGIGVRDLGITQVRFTGGEPLLRPGLGDIVQRVAALPDRPQIALTTNGIGLSKCAEALAAAGLTRINISLDTLDPARFATISHRDRLADVLAGLDSAITAGLHPVKVNAVLLRGINDDEIDGLLDHCASIGAHLRFIEQMPLDPMHQWNRAAMVTADEILDQLTAHRRLTPDPSRRGSAPAETWLVDGGATTVGVIASVTRPFCADCDRTRLTADGQVRNCLFARTEDDLRSPMRSGASDAELVQLWQGAMATKKAGHGIGEPDFAQPTRPMSAIGG